MRIILLIFSLCLISSTVALAVFIEPKSGNVSGSGWNVPFWPFVLGIALVVNPYLHDLVRFYLKTKVDIARAENRVPEEKPAVSLRESKPDEKPKA